MTPFHGSLSIDWIGDGLWRLSEPLYYESRHGLVIVPAGFETDLDSVPRLPLVYMMAKNRTVLGATVHDRLYDSPRIGTQEITRRQADRIMLDAMRDEGVRWRHRWTIYAGVRLGGWLAWRSHRAAAALAVE